MGMGMISAINQNTEARRPRRVPSRLSSVISVPLCFTPSRDEIAEHGHVLTPGRYVGAEEVEDDGIPFTEKMATLTTELADQFAESAKLEKAIRKNMKSLGFELPVGGKK